MFKFFKKWVLVRECLDLEEYGESIFDWDKDFVDCIFERIYYGLIKFVVKGDDSFFYLYYSGELYKKVKFFDVFLFIVIGFGNFGIVKVVFFN